MTTPKPRSTSDTSRSAPDPTTTRVRDELIAKIRAQLAAGGWTQQQAAELCGLTQPCISDLLRGNTSQFSLDALVSVSAALERHSTTEGGTMEYTEADGQRLVAEFMAKLAARPVKGRYPAATESSTTERGGKLIATSGFSTIGGRVAMVGDIVRYADGSEVRHRLRVPEWPPSTRPPAGPGGQRAGQRRPHHRPGLQRHGDRAVRRRSAYHRLARCQLRSLAPEGGQP